MHSVKHEHLSEAEYLAQEAQAPMKHEYVDGQVYAMSGASIRHNRIAGNLYLLWRQKSDCRVTIADVKLRTRRAYYYPDVMLSCAGQTDESIESAPCLVAEVLSPTTEAIDRGAKLRAYREIASLQAYVLVSQDEPLIEVYRRAGELWTYEAISDGRDIALPCTARPLTLDAVYAGLAFDPPSVREPEAGYQAW
ncbi:MAG: Uma2 family endonuclease [Rhodanobacteraceae bacterium]|nr:Uma2 family endonuclease [Rhodanobacteraceae bacterium]